MDGTQQKLSNEKIEEALNLLAEAAKEKKQELINLVSGKYSDLQDAFFDGRSRLADRVSDATHRAADSVRQYTQMGQDRVRDVASRLDENVHASPWSYIGGIAFGALILGYMLGRKSD
jgi:ElaB/YqjD/DUF883 family membrane-anchored ribosome-binding protein